MFILNTETWNYAICYELNALKLNALLLFNGCP